MLWFFKRGRQGDESYYVWAISLVITSMMVQTCRCMCDDVFLTVISFFPRPHLSLLHFLVYASLVKNVINHSKNRVNKQSKRLYRNLLSYIIKKKIQSLKKWSFQTCHFLIFNWRWGTTGSNYRIYLHFLLHACRCYFNLHFSHVCPNRLLITHILPTQKCRNLPHRFCSIDRLTLVLYTLHVTPKCNVVYCGTIKLPLRYSHDCTAPLGDGNTVFQNPHLNRLLLTFQYNESSGATSPCMQLTVCTPSPIMLTSCLQYYFTKLHSPIVHLLELLVPLQLRITGYWVSSHKIAVPNWEVISLTLWHK